jgi:hypothetical protein
VSLLLATRVLDQAIIVMNKLCIFQSWTASTCVGSDLWGLVFGCVGR